MLGKGVIVVNDVPGFVANRVGTQTMNDIMYRAEQTQVKHCRCGCFNWASDWSS